MKAKTIVKIMVKTIAKMVAVQIIMKITAAKQVRLAIQVIQVRLETTETMKSLIILNIQEAKQQLTHRQTQRQAPAPAGLLS